MFARMLVQDAELILLDEPFNAIDAKTTAALLAPGAAVAPAAAHRDCRAARRRLVRQHFPQTLLLARELVGWGATARC